MLHDFTFIRLAESKVPKSEALMRVWNPIYYWWAWKIIHHFVKNFSCIYYAGYFQIVLPDPFSFFVQFLPLEAYLTWKGSLVLWLPGGFNWRSKAKRRGKFMVFISLPLSRAVAVPYPLNHRPCHRVLSIELHFPGYCNCFFLIATWDLRVARAFLLIPEYCVIS